MERRKSQSPVKGRDISPPPLKKRKFESTTTNQTVKSFFTPKSKKAPEQLTWNVAHNTLLAGHYRPVSEAGEVQQRASSQKIAAFDLDSTLITTRTGKIYAADADDWQWWHVSVPSTLKRLDSEGYHIIILTNQGRIALQADAKAPKAAPRLYSTFKTKVGFILHHFDFPIHLYAATGRDNFRKPRSGMWRELLDFLDLDNDRVDLQASFFVGDAGGRAATTEMKADHSCSDRDLAANIGITFHTPEEYFLKQEPRPFQRDFEPSEYLAQMSVSTDSTPIMFEKKNALDIVMMCGSPGCGKSTFYWTKLSPLGYERVNQDTLKTRDTCVNVASSFLDAGAPVAVDNTNADTETRAVWIALAKKHKVPIRCIHFTAPSKLCEHNDTVRALAGAAFNPEQRTILPHSAFAGFRKRFKEPKLSEGFQDITKVDFQYSGNDECKRIWTQYWI